MSVCVLGSINLDIVCRVTELPRPGETITALGLSRFAGGKGANQAVASARWGAKTAMIGAVGEDEAADELLAHLSAAGVNISGIARTANVPTGQAYICVSAAGENMIVVVGGANLTVTPEMIASKNIGNHDIFLAQLETPIAMIESLFARAEGKLRILNAAPALLEAKSLFPLADILIVNETELARYAGVDNLSPANITPAARSLMSRRDQRVIVTLGSEGAIAVDADGVTEVTGRQVSVVDTTGAGDCFCGVLAASLDEGFALPDALARANAAAAHSTQTAGAVVVATLRAEIDALF